MSEIVKAARALPELASEANREHRLCEESYRSALEHAWHAGTALLEAKAQVKHGEWLPWLEANFEGSERHSRRYMTVAQADRTRVADLDAAGVSLRGALREIAPPQERDEQRDPDRDVETLDEALLREWDDLCDREQVEVGRHRLDYERKCLDAGEEPNEHIAKAVVLLARIDFQGTVRGPWRAERILLPLAADPGIPIAARLASARLATLLLDRAAAHLDPDGEPWLLDLPIEQARQEWLDAQDWLEANGSTVPPASQNGGSP